MATLTLLTTAALLCSRADRTLRGTVLPYGEVGLTNLGKLKAKPGRLALKATALPLNLDHDKADVVGRWASIDDTAERLDAVFAIDPGEKGDQVLADAELAAQLAARGMDTGELRCCLSIEVADAVVRGGELVGGTIDGAALLKAGAFPSARLAAGELPDVPDQGDTPAPDPAEPPKVTIDGDALPNVESVEVTPDEVAITLTPDANANPTNQGEPMSTLTAARVQTPALAGATNHEPITKGRLFAALAGVHAMPGGARLEAALSGIGTADILGIEQPQYVGQLWDGTAYERIIIPAFNHADLTSMKVEGWRFKDGKRPEVAKYTGYPNEVHSNDVETEPQAVDAYRVAGGWEVDRKFRDFSNEAFWAAFFAAVTESTKVKTDLYALEDILAAATPVEFDPATLDTGVDVGLAMVVRGIVSVLKGTRTLPDGAFVDVDLWEATMLTRQENVLPMLDAMLGFTEGTMAARKFQLTPCADLDAGQVLVKARAAATVHELPGEAPIRVEALDVAKGAIDEAVFAYQAVDVHNAKGLALVEIA